MNYKHNCTKGPAQVDPKDPARVLGTAGSKGQYTCVMAECPGYQTPREANAKLIAEAFNVLNERGYTPLELVEQKGILIGALKDLMESFVGWTGSYERAEKIVQAIEQGKDIAQLYPLA